MSQWRRIAIEDVPSCKKAIAESATPFDLWHALYEAVSEREAPSEEVSSQVYRFALRCFRTNKPEFLAAQVWIFFDYLLGAYIQGYPVVREDLPKRMPEDIFHYWVKADKEAFSLEKIAAAIKHFHAAKHNSTGKKMPRP